MNTYKDLVIGQEVTLDNGRKARVVDFTTYGTRRGDIRKEVKDSEVEYPTLEGVNKSFLGRIRVVPANVTFTYRDEIKADEIAD